MEGMNKGMTEMELCGYPQTFSENQKKALLNRAIEIVKAPEGLEVKDPFEALLECAKLTGSCPEIDNFMEWLLWNKEAVLRAWRLAETIGRDFTPKEKKKCVDIFYKYNDPDHFVADNLIDFASQYNVKLEKGQVLYILKKTYKGYFDKNKDSSLARLKKLVNFNVCDDVLCWAVAICFKNGRVDWAKELITQYDASETVRQRLVGLIYLQYEERYAHEMTKKILRSEMTPEVKFKLEMAKLDEADIARKSHVRRQQKD